MLESSHMIVDKARPRIFTCINTYTAMHCSFKINRNIIASVIEEE